MVGAVHGSPVRLPCSTPLLLAAPTPGAWSSSRTSIRPLLAGKCYECHSRQSKKAKGGLLLDSREGLLKGGDSGPVLVPGDPDQSLLIKAVRYKDEDLRMPPDGKKLTGAQVADLEAWVKMGALLPGAGVRGAEHQGEFAHALGLSTGETPRDSGGQGRALGTITD